MTTITATKIRRSWLSRTAGVGLALGVLGMPALALAGEGAFPSKALHIVHGGPAGGGIDVYSRWLADMMTPYAGKAIIVEAKPGASGTLAASTFLAAKNDGHTAMVNMNALITELPHSISTTYDPFKDLRPLAEIYQTGLYLVAHPDFPANTVEELVSYVKSQPAGAVSFASYSAGTLSHALGLMLNKAADIEMNHVPYKGTPPAMQDIMGGHIPIGFVGSMNLAGAVEAGKVKLLAYSGEESSLLFPEVPTFVDAGYPDVVATVGVALFVPSSMPEDIQNQWREWALAGLRQPKMRENMATLGHVPVPERTPEAMMESWKSDHDRIGALFQGVKQ